MFEADDIRDWSGQDVVDQENSKIGPKTRTGSRPAYAAQARV